jgi:CheY-like chemotaxis protein
MNAPVRILLVDDDPALRQLTRALLDFAFEHLAHEILEACDGIEALEACDRAEIDVMVLDMHMPRLDGQGVLRELAMRPMRPQVVAWTADPIALGKAGSAGATATVQKANDIDELTEAVRTCLLLADVSAEGKIPEPRVHVDHVVSHPAH